MNHQPLFVVPQPMMKLAGRKISSNPKEWSTEILKAAVQEHPYINLDGVEVQITDYSPEDQRAHGYIGISPQAGVLFTVRPNAMTQAPELDPLDVLFVGGQFRHMNEYSYKQATQQMQNINGSLPKYQKGNAPYSPQAPTSQYVGDLTGDNSPLEPGPTTGVGSPAGRMSMMRTASIRLGSRISNEDMLGRLRSVLSNYRTISLAADMYGLKDVLVHTATSAVAGTPDRRQGVIEAPNAMIITRARGHLEAYKLSFSNGEVRQCGREDLKIMLGDDYQRVIKRLMQRGWAKVSKWTDLASVDYDSVSAMTPAVINPGTYNLRLLVQGTEEERSTQRAITYEQGRINRLQEQLRKNKGKSSDSSDDPYDLQSELSSSKRSLERAVNSAGRNYPMQVVMNCLELDGSRGDEGWKAFAFSPMMGVWVTTDTEFYAHRDDGLDCSIEDMVSRSADWREGVSGPVANGKQFMFWFQGANAVSPRLEIKRILSTPDGDKIYVAKRLLGPQIEVAFRFARSIQRPTEMPATEARAYGLNMPMYLIPSVGCEMVPLHEQPAMLINDMKPELDKVASHMQVVTLERLSKDEWIYNGKLIQDDVELMAKVAGGGMSEERIELLMKTATRHKQRFLLRKEISGPMKVASKTTPYDRGSVATFQKAAEEVLAGVNEGMEAAPEQISMETLDGLLALNLGGEENVDKILEDEGLITEVEDRIARMVMLARMGRENLNESGLRRALKGMDAVNRSVQTLKLEREAAEAL